MPRLLLVLAVLGSAAFAADTPTPPQRLLIFLLAGQSNMAGRGPVEADDATPDPRILVLRDDGWQPAIEPLHRDKPKIAGVGPGLAFARALLAHLPPDVNVGLIPAAFGGTRIEWWAPEFDGEGQRWPDGTTLYAHAIGQARRAQRDGRLAGILWNQGESNVASARADQGRRYQQELVALVTRMRVDLGDERIPFVAATLGPWQEAAAADLNTALLSLPQTLPASAVIDTLAPDVKGRLRAKPDDPIHYDSPSSRLLGSLYAEAILPLLQRERSPAAAGR